MPRRKRLEVTWLSFWELSGVEFCPLFGVLWVPLLQPHFEQNRPLRSVAGHDLYGLMPGTFRRTRYFSKAQTGD